MSATPGYAFGPFRLIPSQRLLLRGGASVSLTPKAFDTLVALIERRDRVVTREELIEELWAGATVEDGNLTQQIFLLRKVLEECGDEQFIATIPRQGYRFVGVVAVLPAATAAGRPISSGVGWRNAALAVVVLFMAAGSAWVYRSLTSTEPATIPSSADRVAIFPFSYRGVEKYAYLGEGLVDLLSRTLDGAGSLHTVDPRAVMGVLAQARNGAGHLMRAGQGSGTAPDEGRAVAERLQATRYVVGDIVEADGRIRITARLYRTDAAVDPVNAAADGTVDDLYLLTDRLTAQLAVGVEGRGVSQLPRTAAATTASIDALKLFLHGEQLFRSGKRDDAFDTYTRAVELDPNFAIGWYRRSQLAYFSGKALPRVMSFAEEAVRQAPKLPWRERRLVEAYGAFTRGAVGESEIAYREILRSDSGDVEALFGIALLGHEYGWLLGGPANPRRGELEAFLRFQPDDFLGNWMLRNAEAQQGNCKAAELLTAKTFPTAAPQQAVAVFCGGDLDAQASMLESAKGWVPGDLRVARLWVNTMAGNPNGAAAFGTLIEERATSTEMLAQDHLALAELELARGRPGAARRQFAKLAAIRNDWAIVDEPYRMLASHHTVGDDQLRTWRESLLRWQAGAVPPSDLAPRAPLFTLLRHDGIHAALRRYLLGRIENRLHSHQIALRYANELEHATYPPDTGSLGRDLALSIRADVFTAQGRIDEALHALESAPREVPFSRRVASWAYIQPEERILRADLLTRLGRLEEALKWYSSVHYWPESVLAAPSHLKQGEILERLGRANDASAHYRRVVDLWRDCDPELRPVRDKAESAVRRLQPRGPTR